MRIRVLQAFAGLAVATMAHAGPGDFDPSFGTNGKATVSYDLAGGNRNDRAVAILPRTDGGLLVVGEVQPAINGHAVVGFARLLQNGLLDISFGGTGRITQETVFERIVDAGVDLSGRIFVAGEYRDPNGGDLEFGVMRYTAAGQPDLGYGLFGVTAAAFDRGGNNEDRIRAISVSPMGEVFAVGRVKVGAAADYDFGIANFDINGAVDTSFNTDGLATVAFDLDGISAEDDGRAISEWDPNTMRVAGIARRNDGTSVVAVASFLTGSGVPTPAFCNATACEGAQGSLVSGPGRRTLRFDPTSASSDFVTGAALQSGGVGGLAVVGTSQLTTGNLRARGAIAVMTGSGLLLPRAGDPLFGRAIMDLGTTTVPTSVVHRFDDGHWIVGGFVGTSPTMFGFAAYVDATAALDDSFTVAGFGGPPIASPYQIVEFQRADNTQPVENVVTAMAIDASQRIVGAGTRLFTRSAGIDDTDYAVFRLDDNDAIFANGFQ